MLIVKSLSDQEKQNFINFIIKTKINFSWSYTDMSGHDPNLVVHNLFVCLDAKPIKHKLHKMHPHIALLIKAELQKMLDVRFIKLIDYPKWVSNIVLIRKATRGIRICTDLWDLNKAFPKDDLLLPNIDMIVDLIEGHEMLSLIDEFYGYNQIKIIEEDQHKTIFTMTWASFWYQVMPFGLKNARETY